MGKYSSLKVQSFLLGLILLVAVQELRAQCTGCTSTFTSNTGSNITVASGQTICVNAGVTLGGTVFLNGGVICNSGTINILKLNTGSGTILNHGTIKDSESSISFGGNVSVYAYASSQFSVSGSSISMGSIDSLYFNTASTGTVTFANGLSISSRKLSINNSGNFIILNTFNINNAALFLYNGSGGFFSASSGATSLSNASSKKIVNTGTLSLSALNVVGAGGGTVSVFVDNNNIFSVTNTLQCTMSSGTLTVNNDVSSAPQMTVGADLILNEASNTLSNTGVLTVGGNITTGAGSASNTGTINCSGNFSVSGTYTSTQICNISSNLVIKSGAKVYNNGTMVVGQSFRNSGKFKMGQKALLRTNNYYNTGSDTLIGVPSSITDTNFYARVSITGISKNTGPLSGRLMVYDESLMTSTMNIEYGFDSLANTSNIGSGILYVLKTISPGTGVALNPIVFTRYFLLPISNFTSSCGTTLTLTASLAIVALPAPFPVTVAGTSWTWTPGPLTGATQTLAPTTTTTYTVKATYASIVFTWVFTGVVVPMIVGINGGSNPILFAPPDATLLTATISGGTAPYTYTWQPNFFYTNLTNNSIYNPQVNPPFSQVYTVSVQDVHGCPAASTVTLIAEPFANLNKIPDGGYYLLFNNKLLFKYHGQYASTTLVCNVYDKTNVLVTTGSFSSLVVNSGDNRYYYDASTLGSGYYTLEVVNEKKEKFTLRFIK